ncbi:5-formyltetrahydrofolate cyclo-ligase-like [Actinia tenebrosa]|uniref:5-formyltetrahydrofolate cyclo-ligase n=1 Tax=Actinia tenebrosa TaxID=6105 RepID=A0A6P8HFG4_ACTTE|nr:5-formyltetrahydrofolate cyclo-ligase-like [Actinia tenebrosa]
MSQAVVFEAKKLLRREIKKRLSAMSAESRARESKLICEKLLSTEEYKSSSRISVYLSMPSEVNTDLILKDIFDSKRKCFIPRYVGSNMDMLRLNSFEEVSTLPITPWNIPQHADDDDREEALLTGGLDLIVVPGLGFTRDGHRLGRGKGYYDKYILKCIEMSHQKPYLIGLGFSCQINDSIPITDTDMTMDKVLFCQPDSST